MDFLILITETERLSRGIYNQWRDRIECSISPRMWVVLFFENEQIFFGKYDEGYEYFVNSTLPIEVVRTYSYYVIRYTSTEALLKFLNGTRFLGDVYLGNSHGETILISELDRDKLCSELGVKFD